MRWEELNGAIREEWRRTHHNVYIGHLSFLDEPAETPFLFEEWLVREANAFATSLEKEINGCFRLGWNLVYVGRRNATLAPLHLVTVTHESFFWVPTNFGTWYPSLELYNEDRTLFAALRYLNRRVKEEKQKLPDKWVVYLHTKMEDALVE